MPDVVDIAVGRRRRADRDRARLRSEVLDVMRRTREIMGGGTVAVRSTEVDLGVVLVTSRSRRPARIDGLSVTMNAPRAAVPAPADIGLPVVLGAGETTTVNVPGAVPTVTDSWACRILAGTG